MGDLGPDEPITQKHLNEVLSNAPWRTDPVEQALMPPPLKDHTLHAFEVFVYGNGRVEINKDGVSSVRKLVPPEVKLLESWVNSVGTLESIKATLPSQF